MTQYYLYILECSNGSLYTGYTTDMQRRYQEHTEGSAKCKYTRSFPPVRIAACWELPDLSQALKLEAAVKKLTKAQKLKLIAEPQNLFKQFAN